MSYDDDNPDLNFIQPDDQFLIIDEMIYDQEKIEAINKMLLPDVFPWFDNESDSYEELINQEIEYPYDE